MDELQRKSKYLHIYEQVRQDIISNVYTAGSKLPSKRDMADNCGVSVITIEHAYELLADEGYIEAHEKCGYFVVYDRQEVFQVGDAASAGRSGRDLPAVKQSRKIPVTGFAGQKRADGTAAERPAGGTGAPDLAGSLLEKGSAGYYPDGTLSYAVYARTARRVMSLYGDEIMMRSPGRGTDFLRRAISSYLRRSRHMDAAPDRIIIGSGAEHLYGLIVKALGRGLVYGIEIPSYSKIEQVYRAEGVELEMLALGHDGISGAALKSAHADVLHITPYRSYPSGVTATASKKQEYLRWSREHGSMIIEDDAESEFSPLRKPEETLYALDGGERVIYVNTFTRTIGPFLRVAYMVVPEGLTGLFEEKTGFYACTVPTLEQYIIAELLESGEFTRHINSVRRKARQQAQVNPLGQR